MLFRSQHSTTYVLNPRYQVSTEICNPPGVAETGGTNRHFVPHFLPGSNNDILNEWITSGDPRRDVGREDWVPQTAARGGIKTIYPEFRSTLNGGASLATLAVPSSHSTVDAAKMIAAQSPRDGQVHVLPVQGNIYMLVADGTNITVSVGHDGVVVVNSGSAAMADKVLAAINQLSQSVAARVAPNTCYGADCGGAWGYSSPYIGTFVASPPAVQPIKFIINTSLAADHVGGNDRLAAAGAGLHGTEFSGIAGNIEGAPVVAHENVVARLSAPAGQKALVPAGALPTMTYFDDLLKLPQYFNGEAIILYYQPAANTDGDSIVHFRRADVIAVEIGRAHV